MIGIPVRVPREWYGFSGLQIPDSMLAPRGPLSLPLDGRSGVLATVWLRILDSLLAAEVASLDAGDAFIVGPSALEDLEPHEKEALDLPAVLEGSTFRLVSRGVPGKASFRLLLEVTPQGHPHPLEDSARRGVFLMVKGELFRLPSRLFGLVDVVDSVPSQPSIPADLRRVAMAKARSQREGVALDSFVRREELVAPEGLTIEADFVAPDELHLRALPVGAEEFEGQIAELEPTELYSRVEGPDRRRRLVLSPAEVAAVELLRRRPVLRGPEVARFQENPEAFLGEAFDLSRFSPRVKGFIPYRYRSQPYLSVRPNASRGWFDVDMGARALTDEGVFDASTPSPPSDPSQPGAEAHPDAGLALPAPGAESPGTEPPGFGPSEFADLCRQVIASGEEYVLHAGDWIKIPLEEANSYLEAWGGLQEAPDGRPGVDQEQLKYILDVATNLEVLEYVEEEPEPRPLPRFGELLDDVPEYAAPSLLRAELRSYQLAGYRWLRYLHERSWGGLLADDMGLGKTVQVIALLAHLKETEDLAPSLLVVPKSLIQNWRKELHRFCPSINRIYVHQGGNRSRSEGFLTANEIVITTYETFRIDQQLLAAIDWSAAICDEAQKIKNPSAKVTSALKAVKARVRVAMTGTPVENGLSELWCIADFVQAGRLGTGKEFRSLIERPIVDAQGETRAQEEALKTLHERLGPHYLRRTKHELRDELPTKQTESYRVRLGDRQAKVYRRVARSVAERIEIPLTGLQRLILTCSHPDLVEASGGQAQALIEDCPKLEKTLNLLESIRDKGEKALIFTRFRKMQGILQAVIAERFKFYASVVNGDVEGGSRQQIINQFEAVSGFAVMILSPEAAGVGLNITAANHVIHYSRLWNPAKERQATDRVYRIGQMRPVVVHYPIVSGEGWKTIEEHIDELLTEKSELAENVIIPSASLTVRGELERRMFEAINA